MGAELRIAGVTCTSLFDEVKILAGCLVESEDGESENTVLSWRVYIHLVIGGADIYCVVGCNVVFGVETKAG
jgi:hypothetical protein